ncbi:MAG: nickel-responsive transcriptional regulator NikR [Candidatus Kariarchaeaceae archaeon]|jgi:CopG family nickel-responsive transcriptional regulator
MPQEDTENKQRFSFTIERELIETLDALIRDTDYNRSMVIREALSHWIDHTTRDKGISGQGLATISYVYDHHEVRLISELMEAQHNFDDVIQTTSHVHLDHDNCFEITIAKGDLDRIKLMGDKLRQIKGISSFTVNYAKSEIKV